MSTRPGTNGPTDLLITAPPRPALFRGVSEATALWPLVIVFALLPSLVPLVHRTLTDETALWNLRAMDVLSARSFAEFAVPGTSVSGPESRLAMAPPLISWVSAFSLWVLSPYPSVALALPSYLFSAGVVLVTYLLGSLLVSRTVGLLGSILVAGSAQLLLLAQTPLPHTLAVCLAMWSLFCYAKHLHCEATHFSRWIPLGGVGWGLCLLAGGAFALVVPAIMALHLVCLKLRSDVKLRRVWRELIVPWRWPPLGAAWLYWLLGIALAGWWHLYLWEAYGTSFWRAWWAMSAAAGAASAFPLTLVPVMPATLVLAIAGTAREIKSALVEEDSGAGRLEGCLLMVLWVCIATLVLLRWGPRSELLRLFLVVPLLLLAAAVLVDLAQRKLSLETGAVLAVATAAVIGLWAAPRVQAAMLQLVMGAAMTAADWLRIHLFLDLVLLTGIAARFAYRWCLRSNRRERWALAGFVVAVVVFSFLRGLFVTQRTTVEDEQLARLSRVAASAGHAEHLTLVADESPPSLLCAVRYACPQRPVSVYRSWEAWASGPDSRKPGVLVYWSRRPTAPAVGLQGFTIAPLGEPVAYRDNQARVYVLRPESGNKTGPAEPARAPSRL